VGIEEGSRASAEVLEDFKETEEGSKVMTSYPRPTAGDALTVVGVLHTTVGLAKYRRTLRKMAREGVIDTVKGDREREAALWFLTCGASLILTGRLARWTQLQTGTLPASTGTMLLGTGAAGAALLPRSGFWALFVPAILASKISRRRDANQS